MKLTLMILIVCFVQVSASVYSQSSKFSFDLKNKQVREVLKEIEEQSDYHFFYQEEQVDVSREVNIQISNQTVEQVLAELFKNEGITYRIFNDHMILLTVGDINNDGSSIGDRKKNVEGKVTDSIGQPVPGVSVRVKGTTQGTITDFNGAYSLVEIQEDAVLVFSFVGMKNQEIEVAGKSVVNVVMEEESIGIGEVVAVGYGTQRKRDVSGAISSIKTEDVNAGVVTSSAQILKGRAAGVLVRQNSSEPGGGISIRIRGASSVSSNNEPLYVVDGFPTDLGKTINPGDIESIEILKDAAATAIYGARGANGVVLITTKQGKNGVFNVHYSYDYSVKNLYNPYHLMDAQDIMQYNIKLAKENGTYETNPPYTDEELKYTGKGTDWLDLTTRVAPTQNHQLSITGGQDKLQMAITSGYLTDKGILKNTSYDRFTGRMNLEYKLNDKVHFGSNMYLGRSNKNYQNMGTRSTVDNVIYNILLASPLSLAEGGDVFGNPGQTPQLLNQLYEPEIEKVTNDFYSSIFGSIDVLKYLTARVQFTYQNGNSKDQQYYPKTTNTGKAYGGLAGIVNSKDDKYQLDAILTYHKKMADIHDVKIIAGTTYTKQIGEENGITASDFLTDEFSFNNIGAGKTVESVYSSKWQATKNSYFARGEYVLNDKYMLNMSLRADGSSNFGEGNKWGYFPAVSAAWQIGDEQWMDFSKSLFSTIKLRASYGITGNDGIGNYLSFAKYGTTSVYLGGAEVQKGSYKTNASNDKLKWEETSQLNIGLDFSMLNNRLQFNFDYYRKHTKDLLNPISISMATQGFSSVTGNNGELENKGFELYIKSNNVSSPNFKWNTTLNLSRNKNKILDINEGKAVYESIMPQGWYNNEEYAVLKEGYALSSIYGYVFDGIIQEGETYSPQPNSVPGDPKFKDLDNSGEITSADRKVIGNGNPDIIIGLGNDFQLHDFSFSFFFDSNLGHELFAVTKLVLEDNNRTRNTMNRWTKQNPSTEIPRNGYQKNDGLQYGSFVNSRFVEDASFLRLSNISLEYSVPFDKLSQGLRFARVLKIGIGAQNLFTITNYSGFNPEVSTNGDSATSQGLDYNAYPSYRIFYSSIKLTF